MSSLISGIAVPLGWALIHFLWQGLGLAALAAIAMQLCRHSSARYVIGVTALGAMLAAPIVTLVAGDPVPAGFAPLVSRLAMTVPPQFLPWLVEAWFCGVVFLSLRATGGFLLLDWRIRNCSQDASPRLTALCRQVEQRLGITQAIRYLECGWIQAPAGFGCLKPVILLPVALLTGLSEDQLRAVIAHELAHIRRWDFAVNLFQIAVGTLLFYHPAVWWLNRRIRETREICCDDIAAGECPDRIEYARALALLAETRAAPALTMAINHGMLTARIRRLVWGDRFDIRVFAAGIAASLLLLVVSLAGGNALLQRARPPVAQMLAENIQPAPAAAMPHGMARRVRPRIALAPITISYPALPPVEDNDQMPAEIPVSAIPVSDTSQSPDAVEFYPAAVLSIMAPHVPSEWERTEASNYCDQFAQQTVLQGAIKPLVVDDAAKARYGFFYSRCMLRNGEVNGQDRVLSPTYAPLGVAAPDHAANAAGSWAIAFSPFPARWSCNFTQAGNVLDGNCTRAQGGGAAHGVVDGKQIRWRWAFLDDEKQQVELDFIGMIGADGVLNGQVIPRQNTDLLRQIQPFTARPGPLVTQVASQ